MRAPYCVGQGQLRTLLKLSKQRTFTKYRSSREYAWHQGLKRVPLELRDQRAATNIAVHDRKYAGPNDYSWTRVALRWTRATLLYPR